MNRATLRKRPGPAPAAVALAVAVTLAFCAPAAADLLVTRDGSVIEIEGAWEVRGRLVVFELPDGQLASMKLSEVDLDASRAATEKAAAAAVARESPPAAPPAERTAVMVITDADVRPATPLDSGAEEGAAAAEEGAAPPAAAPRLVVSSWDETSGPEGVVITGELVNQSPDVAANIELGVLFYDREGEVLGTVLADVTAEVLQPGQRARFRADAEQIFSFSAVRFEAESLGLAVGAQQESPGDEG